MSFLELLLLLVHIFALISWLGAMYFNLVLIFPTYQAAFDDINKEKRLYQVQGTRAAIWLYAFIGLTFTSGIALALISDSYVNTPLLVIKFCLLVIMLCMHLVGSLHIWPQIMFAIGDDVRNLLFKYKATMFISAAMGSIAVTLSYGSRLF